MTGGEVFASMMEDHQVTAGFALSVLDCAEAVYPAPYFAQCPRNLLTIRFHSPDNVEMRVS